MVFLEPELGFDCVPPLLLEDDDVFFELPKLPLFLAHVDSVFRRNRMRKEARATSLNLPIMALKRKGFQLEMIIKQLNIIKNQFVPFFPLLLYDIQIKAESFHLM